MNKLSRKLTLIIISLLFTFNISKAQQKDNETKKVIDWLSFESAIKKADKKPRPIFIDVYTNWCGWCKRMDATTFANDSVINIMNKNFYAVKFNAEQKEDINFKGSIYKNENQTVAKSTHSFTTALLKGSGGYPSFVILDGNGDWLYKIVGYKTAEEIIPILRYYGEGHYLKMSWSEFSKL